MSLWSRIRNAFRPGSHLQEIHEELEFHLEMDEAHGRNRREARLHLGNVQRIAEETRAVGTVAWLDSLSLDAKYGLRQLRRSPALSLAIVLSLAIGLGANTAIFTLVDAVLLKPLPVSDPDRLVMLEWTAEGGFAAMQAMGIGRMGAPPRMLEGGQIQYRAVSEAVHREFAARQTAFASVIGFSRPQPMALSDGSGVAEQVNVQYVSANFFSGLGVPPTLGRAIVDRPFSPLVAVVRVRTRRSPVAPAAYSRRPPGPIISARDPR